MNEKDILKVMLQKKEVKTAIEKGQKYLIYGEISIKYDTLEVKKDKVYLYLNKVNIAVIK